MFARHAPPAEPPVTRRVRRGCELLDRYRPAWAAEIDLDRLDVASSRDCPLGQLYDTYDNGKMQLAILSGARYGLNVPRWTRLIHGMRSKRVADDYAALTAEWSRQIHVRRLRHAIDRMGRLIAETHREMLTHRPHP